MYGNYLLLCQLSYSVADRQFNHAVIFFLPVALIAVILTLSRNICYLNLNRKL